MGRADVACIECRRRKIACSKKLPHCTECLVHARDCCYNRDKRRRVDEDGVRVPKSAASAGSSSHGSLGQYVLDPDHSVFARDLPQAVENESIETRDNFGIFERQINVLPSPRHVWPLASSTPNDLFGATEPLGGSVSDALNDTFWWLASQWQNTLTPDAWTQWPELAQYSTNSNAVQLPTSTHSSDRSTAQTDTSVDAPARESVRPTPVEARVPDPPELYEAYLRCLPARSRWSKLFKVLEKLCQTVRGGSGASMSPFLSLTRLQEQLGSDIRAQGPCNRERDRDLDRPPGSEQLSTSLRMPVASSDLHETVLPSSEVRMQRQSSESSNSRPGRLRRAWVLAALCLASSSSASSLIKLPFCLETESEDFDSTATLFSVAWSHCRAGLQGDPIEVMQTYRMMSLAFSRCDGGHELTCASVFLGCRAASSMSVHRISTIGDLGSPSRQQEVLNAFWHLISQGCHFKAWEGREMPIDMALVELPMPDPKVSLQQTSNSSTNTSARDEQSTLLLSTSPVFMSRIWTSVAVGQTVERHYRQGASILVPYETRLEVSAPLATSPSPEEQNHISQTAKALDFCSSLLQTREVGRQETKESHLKRFVLMLIRYSRVLLHYPFCRADKDHRKTTQESVSTIISTVLGTLLSLEGYNAAEIRNRRSLGGRRPRDSSDAPHQRRRKERRSSSSSSAGSSNESSLSSSSGIDTGSDSDRGLRNIDANRDTAPTSRQARTQEARDGSPTVDRHLLSFLAGLMIRGLVFTLALIQHPLLPSAVGKSFQDDRNRQMTDAILALRALEQLNQRQIVPHRLLRQLRRKAKSHGVI